MKNIIGDISFGVGADTTGLDRSLDRLRAFGRTVDQVAATQVGAAQSVTRAYNAQEKAMRSAIGKAAEMQRMIRASSAGSTQMGSMLGQVTNSLNAYTRAMSSGQLNSVQFTRATDRFNISMGKLKNTLGQLKPPTQPVNSFGAVLKDLSSTAILAAGPLSGLSSRFAALNSIASRSTIVMAGFLAGTAAVSLGTIKLASAAVNASMEIDRINAVFMAATGSMVAGGKEFEYVEGVANKLGLELKSTAQSYAQFTAATRGTRLEGQGAREVFEATAMAATALKLSADDTTGVIKALTQMVSKGTIQAEELRGQLGDRLPGAFSLMADALGVTERKLGEMMKKGEVLSDEALPKLAKQMALVYGGPAEVAAQQLQASINRLSTAQLKFNDAVDEATGISVTYQRIIDGTAGILNKLTENMGNIKKVLVVTTGAIIGFGTAFAAAFAIGKWTAVIAVLGKARTAVLAFNAALLLNPVVLAAVAAALAGAGIAYMLYAKQAKEANDVQTQASITTANEFVKSQNRIVTASKQTTEAYIEDVQKRLQASMLSIQALDEELRALEKQQQQYSGTILAPSDKRVDNARQKYNAEGQRIITMMGLIEKLNKIKGKAKDPADMPSDILGDDKLTGKLDKMKETADELEVIRQRTAAINALPDYWLQGSQSLEEFNKSLDNGKKLEAYEDKLIRAGYSAQQVAEKLKEMDEALRDSDAAEMRLKRIEERAKALDQVGSNALDSFGSFLESLNDETKDVAESFSDMVNSIISDLRRLVIQQTILDPLKEALFGTTGGSGSGGGLWGALGDALGSIFGGTSSYDPATTPPPRKPTLSGYRANGGPVMAGRAYEVGERGRERFIPSTNGTIIPNHELGGQTQINVIIRNNNGSQVTARQADNGRDLEIIVDDLIAKKLGDPSSRSSRAMRNSGNMIAGR